MSFFKTFLGHYNRHQAASPYLTNFVTGGILGGTGDIICQKSFNDENTPFDYQRFASMLTFGAVYSGGFSTLVYSSYSRFPKFLINTPAKMGLTCTLVDNFLHVPLLYTPAFYVMTGLMQGRTLAESTTTLRSGYLTSLGSCWLMWVPVQFVNFTYVPVQLRVAFVNAGCLVWNVLLDFIAHNANEDRLKDEQKEPAGVGRRKSLRREKGKGESFAAQIGSYPTHK